MRCSDMFNVKMKKYLSVIVIALMMTVLPNVCLYMSAESAETGLQTSGLVIKLNDAGVVTTAAAFSLQDLQKMSMIRQAYSSVDSMPAPVVTSAEGVLLADVISCAGISLEKVTSVKIKASDGYSLTFSKEKLFGTERYYYPHLMDGFNFDEYPQLGSTAEKDKVRVQPIIAIKTYQRRFSLAPEFDKIDSLSALRFCYGQSVPTEINNNSYVKYVQELEISINPINSINILTKNVTNQSYKDEDDDAPVSNFSFCTYRSTPVPSMKFVWGILPEQIKDAKVVYRKNSKETGSDIIVNAYEKNISGTAIAVSSLDGIQLNTEYTYTLYPSETKKESKITIPNGSNGNFTFFFMGDVQQGYPGWSDMLKNISNQRIKANLLLLGGDLVNSGNDVGEWEKFLCAGGEFLSSHIVMPVPGNHDDSEIFADLFSCAGDKHKSYSFDYGNAHFIMLNSNALFAGETEKKDILQWIHADLQSSSQKWKFVVMHYPPFPVFVDGHAEVLQEDVVPILEKNNVDVVFSGHQHIYMRSRPINRSGVGGKVIYTIGNSGAKHYSLQSSDSEHVDSLVENISNYMLVSVADDQCILAAYDETGKEIDKYMFRKVGQ